MKGKETAHFTDKNQTPSLKLSDHFSGQTILSRERNTQQAHPNNCAPSRGVHGQMRHGERTNKIPTYIKMLQSDATRNTQHATRNTQHATRNTQHATQLYSPNKNRVNYTNHLTLFFHQKIIVFLIFQSLGKRQATEGRTTFDRIRLFHISILRSFL